MEIIVEFITGAALLLAKWVKECNYPVSTMNYIMFREKLLKNLFLLVEKYFLFLS